MDYYQYSMDFPEWLQDKLHQRGWSYSEAARRSGISDSMISKVITRYSQPRIDFILGISGALGISPMEVFARSVSIWMDEASQADMDAWKLTLDQLSRDNQDELYRIAQVKLKIQEERKREYGNLAAKGMPVKDLSSEKDIKQTIEKWALENGYVVHKLELAPKRKPAAESRS